MGAGVGWGGEDCHDSDVIGGDMECYEGVVGGEREK